MSPVYPITITHRTGSWDVCYSGIVVASCLTFARAKETAEARYHGITGWKRRGPGWYEAVEGGGAT